MNLYVRYFDHETLALSMDDVATFLTTLREVKLNDDMLRRVSDFWHSDNAYPYRLKVSYSNYILFLKTEAKDMEEFKTLERQNKERRNEGRMSLAEKKRSQLEVLNERHEGWYEASILFKRVVLNPESGKCQYVDTLFRVRLKATSAMNCYERIVDHLQNRQDVDPRSQFPSAKSANFEYKFLGEDKSAEEEPAPVPAEGEKPLTEEEK